MDRVLLFFGQTATGSTDSYNFFDYVEINIPNCAKTVCPRIVVDFTDTVSAFSFQVIVDINITDTMVMSM